MVSTQKYTNMNTKIHKSALLYPRLGYIIQGCIFETRKQYGPGQKEIIYHRILEEKLVNKGLTVEKEKRINVYSQDSGKVIGLYQPDILVQQKIILEIKSSSFTTRTDEKQLYHYLRNSSYELGFLVNFSTPKLYLKRIIYTNDRKPWLKFSCWFVFCFVCIRVIIPPCPKEFFWLSFPSASFSAYA